MPGARMYELATIGATLMGIVYLYGVYSSVKRGVEVTGNAIHFRQMEQSIAGSVKELADQAEQYRREAAAESDLLRAERMRQLADEADTMRRELAKLASDLENAKVEYKKAETLNNFLNAFGGDTGAVLAPVLDQAFQFDPPGAAASLSIQDYFAKKLGAPIEPALQAELTARMFQVTLERAFRECGVSSANLERTADCVGTELLLLNNKLGAYGGRTQATQKVRELITKSLSTEELRRLLRNRLEQGEFDIDGGASAEEAPEPAELVDAGAAPADGSRESWPGRWSGVAKLVMNLGGTHSDVRMPMELDVRVQGKNVVITTSGAKADAPPMVLALSAKNPNVASGEDKSQWNFDTGSLSGRGQSAAKIVAFLRGGRLYLAIQSKAEGQSRLTVHSAEAESSVSVAAMLDRVE